jgi:hypothetical protein
MTEMHVEHAGVNADTLHLGGVVSATTVFYTLYFLAFRSPHDLVDTSVR